MDAVFVLGSIAGLILLAIMAHVTALQRYSKLLDASFTPQVDAAAGKVRGRFADRPAACSLTLPRRRPKQPGELCVSLECSAPLTFRIRRESLSTGFHKALGIRHDRTSGDEALDRKFLFEFDDRARFTDCIQRTELRDSLLTMAGLGVDSIYLERESITASIPLRLLLPPRADRVRQVLHQLATIASAMELALVGRSEPEGGTSIAKPAPARSQGRAEESRWHRTRTKGANLSVALLPMSFFAAVVLAYLIAAPMWAMWERGTQASWQEQATLMRTRLVIASLVAGGIGLLAAYLVGGKPIMWGVSLSWPMFLYTAVIWAYYAVLMTSGAPIFESGVAEPEGPVTGALTTLTAAPVLLLLGGWVGARLGNRGRAQTLGSTRDSPR